MSAVSNLVIIGVGLIGGSIGKAALARGVARKVVGVGRNAENLQAAKRVGAVHETTTDLAAACADADLIIVCTPVDTVARFVREAAAAAKSQPLITDAGSVKASIISSLAGDLPNGARFIGGHPLAGSEKTGAENARGDLFENRVIVVTPTAANPLADLLRLTEFWQALGANVRVMSPEEHDRAVAETSHAPHLVAAALAAATSEVHLPLVSTGWLDATRIAAMDEKIWQPIFAANRTHTLKALGEIEKTLAELRAALARDDRETLGRLLAKADATRGKASDCFHHAPRGEG